MTGADHLHSLLRRQIQKHAGDAKSLPSGIEALLTSISQAYQDSDADRVLNERALEISSRELVESNSRLRYQRDLFQSFMDNSPLIAYMQDESGRYSYVNRKFSGLAGREPKEILGFSEAQLRQALTPLPAPESPRIDLGTSVEIGETWPVGGELHDWMVLKFQVLDVLGKKHVASLGMDVTERLKVEEQLRQSQKLNAIGRLAGGIAHDFNNLLTVIIGYAHTLLESPADAIESGDVQEILRAAERAAGLTRQLLVFGRKQVVQMKRLDLNLILEEMEKMLCRLIGEDVQMSTRRKPGLWRVRADSGQVQQVIMNLALNARDAMPKGGLLTVETENVVLDETLGSHYGLAAGQYVQLSVTDTGVGMTTDVRARLFEPFFTTKRVGEGTGLGLSTVYGIVVQSHGQITVYTEVGRGSTFKVFLPRVLEERISTSPSIRAQGPQGGVERILIVEDEAMVRSFLVNRLVSKGYSVLTARNGAEALEVVRREKQPFRLVISDIVMPVMGGVELVRRLRAQCPGIKALFTSGYPDGAMTQQGEIHEDTPFLSKPFAAADLLRKVRETLDSSGEAGRAEV